MVELWKAERSSVEEALNGLLKQESQHMTTTSDDVEMKVPKLKRIPFETAIIDRYRRRKKVAWRKR